jgi:drug/metabolite transporter (DMT)-like permease
MPFVMAMLSSVLYGIGDFLGGMGSRRAPVIAVTAWFQITGVAFLVLYALFAPGETRPADLAWAAAAGAAGGLGVTLLYNALASGTVSTAAPMISMVALTVPVLVGLASGERPGALPLFGIALAVVAVVLISARGHAAAEPHGGEDAVGPTKRNATPASKDRTRALLLALASGVLIGLFLVFLGRIAPGASGWPLVAGRATATLCLFALLLASRTSARLPAAAVPPMLGAAVTDVSANVLYLLAVQRAPLSLVATFVSLAPATTVLLAQLVLRERLAPAQRAGVALALVAVVLLAQG